MTHLQGNEHMQGKQSSDYAASDNPCAAANVSTATVSLQHSWLKHPSQGFYLRKKKKKEYNF